MICMTAVLRMVVTAMGCPQRPLRPRSGRSADHSPPPSDKQVQGCTWERLRECHNAFRPSVGAKIMAIGILLGVTVMMAAFAGVVIFGRKRGLL